MLPSQVYFPELIQLLQMPPPATRIYMIRVQTEFSFKKYIIYTRDQTILEQ